MSEPIKPQDIIDELDKEAKAALNKAARILCTSDGTGSGPLAVSEQMRALVSGVGRLKSLASEIDRLAETLEEVLNPASADTAKNGGEGKQRRRTSKK